MIGQDFGKLSTLLYTTTREVSNCRTRSVKVGKVVALGMDFHFLLYHIQFYPYQVGHSLRQGDHKLWSSIIVDSAVGVD